MNIYLHHFYKHISKRILITLTSWNILPPPYSCILIMSLSIWLRMSILFSKNLKRCILHAYSAQFVYIISNRIETTSSTFMKFLFCFVSPQCSYAAIRCLLKMSIIKFRIYLLFEYCHQSTTNADTEAIGMRIKLTISCQVFIREIWRRHLICFHGLGTVPVKL